MKMSEIIKRCILIKGPYWHRAYLISFYVVFILYFELFLLFFSLPPGPEWAMSSRMERVMIIKFADRLPLLFFIGLLWIAASLTGVFKTIKKTTDEPWGLILSLLLILEYGVFAFIFNELLSGRWSFIHEFIYYLPERM